MQVSCPPPDRTLQLTEWQDDHPGVPHGGGNHRAPPVQWSDPRDGSTFIGTLIGYARAHAVQLVRFALIGAGIAGLNLLFLYYFRVRLHLTDPPAVTAMYLLGAALHFTAHRWITYGVQDCPVLPQGRRYAVMLVWNYLLMQALVGMASRLSISPYIAVIVATGCGMVFNFLFMTHVVFKRDRAAYSQPGECK